MLKKTLPIGIVSSLAYLILTTRAAFAECLVNRVQGETVFAFTNLGDLITKVLGLLLFLAGLLALLFLVIGGIQWISSGGDKIAAAAARDRITAAIIGLIIVVATYALARVIEGVFGIPIVGGFNIPGVNNPIGCVGG